MGFERVKGKASFKTNKASHWFLRLDKQNIIQIVCIYELSLHWSEDNDKVKNIRMKREKMTRMYKMDDSNIWATNNFLKLN